MKERPNPDKLLKQAQEEESVAKRGKLKIYLGAAPGVGKTHEMLHDALEEQAKGLDVIVGIVESHGRQEIEAMLKNAKILSRLTVDYHGKKLYEFDLDAALKKDPQLILIDEMAHSNAPGLRHNKRWQDIRELLDRGIDVYTTLNVQHIESLNDSVSQIIHAPIKETIPDFMIERADTIELVDIPPEELLERLREGKVYFAGQAELASHLFFRKGNLIALRELALRTAAEQVGTQVLLYRQGQGIKHIWPTKEKILVCIGTGEGSTKLVRAAKRLASSLQVDWVAVHIDTPRIKSEEQRAQALKTLKLAEQLGAQIRVLTGWDVVKEIMNFAREQNVTQIMIWKPIHSRFLDFFFPSLADEMLRHCGEIDIYIMTGEAQKQIENKIVETPWKIYALAIAVPIIATLFNIIIYPFLSSTNLLLIYFLGVTVIAFFGRTGPSILTSLLSVLTYVFFFVPPYYRFSVMHVEYLFTLGIMLILSQIIIQLMSLTRHQAKAARAMEYQSSALYALSRRLSSTRGMDNLLQSGISYIAEVFDSDILALLPNNHHLVIRAQNREHKKLDEKEKSIAEWSFEMGQKAGLGTDSLSFSEAVFVPLLGLQSVLGVLRVKPMKKENILSPEKMQLLEACTHELSLALEVDRLHEQERGLWQNQHH